MLLIDDIFLGEEELNNSSRLLCEANKQIVMSEDRPPGVAAGDPLPRSWTSKAAGGQSPY
ncbi:MAG: hypothetical protein ACLR23_26265 [Clostridia bacterium]